MFKDGLKLYKDTIYEEYFRRNDDHPPSRNNLVHFNLIFDNYFITELREFFQINVFQ